MAYIKKADYIAQFGEDAWKEFCAKQTERTRRYHQKTGYGKKYRQANKEKRAEQAKEYYQANKEKLLNYHKQYYNEHRDKILESNKDSAIARSNQQAGTYKNTDNKYNRGLCTIDGKWIRENIYAKSCIYCGENDWRKLGCDRVDNTKSHTPDNVVCSCWDCNNKRRKEGFEKFLYKSWRKRFNS